MKGVSPFVATILLIALTVGIGGLISVFVTNLVTSSSGVTSNQSQSGSLCAGAWINVNSVQSSRIIYSNPTSQNITNVSITGDGMTGAAVPLLNVLTSGNTIVNKSTDGNLGFSVGTNTTFILRGLCQSIIPVEGNCKIGQSCWNS